MITGSSHDFASLTAAGSKCDYRLRLHVIKRFLLKQPFIVVEVAPYIRRAEGVGSQFVRNQGGDVTLPCNAFGIPQPTVIWYKERSVLPCLTHSLKHYNVNPEINHEINHGINHGINHEVNHEINHKICCLLIC